GHVRGQERERAPRLGKVRKTADGVEPGGGRRPHSPAPVACAGAPFATPAARAEAPEAAAESAPTFASGLASTPASLRCAAVIGAGAPVSGSYPPPDFGKAITSRIDSAPASSATIRSQPKAIPPCGGDRKSTRLNSSHVSISYDLFCLNI